MAERAHPEDPSFQGTVFEERLRERYAFTLPYIQGKDVLDAPCGTGWGTSMLSGAASLTGIDIDPEAIAYAHQNFPGPHFFEGNLCSLPFENGNFDVIVCLEGLEHIFLSEVQPFLSEVHRVLRYNGVLIITSPILDGGRHSGNPYHMYEFNEDELRSLLTDWFRPVDVKLVAGPDGPELWFVGKRREKPSQVFRPPIAAHSLTERALTWANAQRLDNGFRFAEGHKSTLLGTCFGVLTLEGLGALYTLSDEEREATVALIQSMQRDEDGVFADPLLDCTDLGDGGHDVEYLLHQMTYFSIHALDAFGERTLYPIRFLERFEDPQALNAWLDGLDWSNAWLQSNRVMFVLFFLIYRFEMEGNTAAPALVHQIIDWLDDFQDTKTGLWGIEQGSSPINAMAAAYHFLPFYDYIRRPICRVEAIIDSTLALQQVDGLFASRIGGGACEDLDAIDVLAICGRITAYRQDEIKRALVRAFWSIWNAQNEDGGFGYAVRPDGETYCYSGWAPMEQGQRDSDIWATWFRLLALATIQKLYPDDLPSLPSWTFRNRPALGFHRFDGQIKECEKVLVHWLRPLPIPEPTTRQEPLISVIVPCFNLGLYLYEAIASILNQTYQSFEVIVVDDGSNDPFTGLVLAHLIHPNVRVLHQQNRGLAAARNAGIDSARCEAICCLDADDRLHPTFLEKAMALLDADERVGFVSCFIQEFDGRSGQICYPTCDLPEMLYTNRAIVASLFRRKAWLAAGGYCEELTGMQDWDLWIGILEAGYKSAVVPEALFEYRIRAGSMYTKTRQPENYSRLVDQIIARHEKLYESWKREVIVGQARMFAEIVEYAEGQSRLARSTEHPSLKEKLRLIEDLRLVEEARDFHIQQTKNWEIIAKQSECEKESAQAAFTEATDLLNEIQVRLREIEISKTYRLSLIFRKMVYSPLKMRTHFSEMIKTILPINIKTKLKNGYFRCYNILKEIQTRKKIKNKKWPDDRPLISVIIPCYNYGRYIETSIESVLNQSFTDFEIIIVDGGSTDSFTLEKLRKLSKPKSRVYFRNRQHLVGDNRNYGIQRAQGKYICCLDPDDLIHPTYFEKALFLAELHNYDIVYPSVQCFEGSNLLWTVGNVDLISCAEGNTISTVGIFKKEAWKKVKGFKDWGLGENHVPEDWEFWTRLLGNGFRARRIPEPLMLYRVHGAGLTANNKKSFEKQKIAIKKANSELFSEKNLAKIKKIETKKFEVKNSLINLKKWSSNEKGVLFALPFMITGGADNILLQIANLLKKNGFNIICLTSIESNKELGDNSPRYESITKRIYHLPKFLECQDDWKKFVFYLIETDQVHIIFIIGCEFLYNLLPEIKTKYPHVNIIDQLFNEFGHLQNNRKYREFIDLNIVANNKIRDILINENSEKYEKIKVIIHGIDVNWEYNPSIVRGKYLNSSIPLPENKFIIGFFGRFSEEKAPDLFVEIAKNLEKYENIYFVMTGNGPEYTKTKNMIKELGLESSFYTPGFVDDVLPYMLRTSVLIIPSRIEGIPVILLESLSLGIPVIASSVGGIPSIISDGYNGFLSSPQDVGNFVEKVVELYNDERLRVNISSNARTYAEKYIDIDKMNKEYLEAFQNILTN